MKPGLATSLIAAAACVLALAMAAQPTRAAEPDRPAPAAANRPARVACVGDSITYGAGVANREQNAYPVVLGKLLGDKHEVRNFGVSGATLLKNGDKPYWKEKAFAQAKEFNPNVVIIKLGTNDSKPQNWKHKDQFAADAKDLIETFQGLPAKPKVFVCRPVPAYPGNFGITDKVIREEVIPLLDEAAKDRKAAVIDLYKALSDQPKLFPDKVHPNAEGARLMAETVYAALTGKEVPKAEK